MIIPYLHPETTLRVLWGVMVPCLGAIGSGGPPPHPVIVTIQDNKDHLRAVLYSLYLYHNYRVGVYLSYTLPPKVELHTVDRKNLHDLAI